MWNETTVTYFKRLARVWAENREWKLLNTKQEC